MDGPLVFGLSNGKDNNYGMILHIIFAFSMDIFFWMKKRENTANQSSISNYLSLLKYEIRKSNYVMNRTDIKFSRADLPVRWCKRIFDISFDDRCFSSWGATNKQYFANLYFRSQHSLVKIMNFSIKEACKIKLLKQNEGTKPVLQCWSKMCCTKNFTFLTWLLKVCGVCLNWSRM